MLSLWQRLPVIVRAVLAGAAVATAGTVPWALLGAANQKVLVAVPWAIVPMSLYLWLLWRWLRGEGWPRGTSEARRISLRANPLSPDIWGMALFAGILGLVAFLPFIGLLGRVVRLPAESQPIVLPPGMPFVTAFLLLVMASIVAGVVEEAAFRGYFQGPIERRHGFLVALLLSGGLFGLAHFTHHPSAVIAMLPYYTIVSAIYGGLAYATNSIMPSLVLHAGGDVLMLNRLWLTGRAEWQTAAQPAPLIWETGADSAFWGYLTAFLLLGAAAVWAYVALAAAARNERAGVLLPLR